ncbi:MAG: DUF2512 family protein [Bacillota bacterium]
MTGLIMKIIACPAALLLSDLLFAGIDFGSAYQAVIVGLILAVSAHLMELLILRRGTFWISLTADFVTATLIIYFVSNLFYNAYVTLTGAVLAALIVGVTEYLQHAYLIRTGKTKKVAHR